MTKCFLLTAISITKCHWNFQKIAFALHKYRFKQIKPVLDQAKKSDLNPIDNFEFTSEINKKWKDSNVMKNDEFWSRLFQRDNEQGNLTYLHKYVIMIALLNIVGIQNRKTIRPKYPTLHRIFSADNLLDANFNHEFKEDKDDTFDYTLRSLIDITNQHLDNQTANFRVPNDIFRGKFTSIRHIYETISANPLVRGCTQIFLVNQSAVKQKNITSFSKQYSFEQQTHKKDILGPLQRFVSLTSMQPQSKHRIHDTGRYFAYVLSGSDITAAKLLDDFIQDPEETKDYGLVINVDVSRITKETSFLRCVLKKLNPEIPREQLHYFSLHTLKRQFVKELLTFEQCNVLWVLTSKTPGVNPRTMEFSSTIQRSFVENLLSDLAHEVESNREFPIQMRIIVAVRGTYKGYHSPSATKISFPPPNKQAWLNYCEKNAIASETKANAFAAKVIKHLPLSQISSSVINALLCLDEYIPFETRGDEVELILNKELIETKQLEASKNTDQVIARSKDSFYFRDIDCQIDWREQMFSAVVNNRTSQRFAKLICHYLFARHRADLYFLILAIAYSDDGLTRNSMLKISQFLGLGLQIQEISNFIEETRSILIEVDNQQLPDDAGFEEAEETGVSWEVMEPLRHSLCLHGQTYLQIPGYGQIERYLNECRFDKSSARIINKEEIHWAIGKLAFSLYDKSEKKYIEGKTKTDLKNQDYIVNSDSHNSKTNSNDFRRSRLRYLSIAIKHLLRAISHKDINEPQERLYYSLSEYRHILLSKPFSELSPSLLINMCWKIYFHGLESQPQSVDPFRFYQSKSNNNCMLSNEIIKFMSSTGLPHLVSHFHVPLLFKSSLDDASYLRFLTTAAVNFWASAQSANLQHCYEKYLDHFVSYFRWDANIVIDRTLEGWPVAFFCRESMSRITLLHIRSLVDRCLVFRAKNLIKLLISDLDQLTFACLKRLNEIEEHIINVKTSTEIRNSNSHLSQLEQRKSQLLELLQKIYKKRLL